MSSSPFKIYFGYFIIILFAFNEQKFDRISSRIIPTWWKIVNWWFFAVAGGLGVTLFEFGTGGISAGSLAVVTQVSIGNVAFCPILAGMTSFGMTGVFSITAVGGTVIVAIGALAVQI